MAWLEMESGHYRELEFLGLCNLRQEQSSQMSRPCENYNFFALSPFYATIFGAGDKLLSNMFTSANNQGLIAWI